MRSSKGKISVAVDDEGFRLSNALDKNHRWSDVCRIASYKLDAITVDVVVVEVLVGDESIRVTDDDHGFWIFVEGFETRLLNGQRGWRNKVLQPPFAENYTVVYERISDVRSL